MGVAGAPERANNHAELIMDLALDMRDVVQFVTGMAKAPITALLRWNLGGLTVITTSHRICFLQGQATE